MGGVRSGGVLTEIINRGWRQNAVGQLKRMLHLFELTAFPESAALLHGGIA